MHTSASIEIQCPACGRETLLRRTPRYEGFKKVGEQLSCLGCGHRFAGEQDVPFRHKAAPAVFAPDERPAAVRIFAEDENACLCRYCRHYLVHPFVQRCAVHKKEVEATDTCARFDRKPPPKEVPPGAVPQIA